MGRYTCLFSVYVCPSVLYFSAVTETSTETVGVGQQIRKQTRDKIVGQTQRCDWSTNIIDLNKTTRREPLSLGYVHCGIQRLLPRLRQRL